MLVLPAQPAVLFGKILGVRSGLAEDLAPPLAQRSGADAQIGRDLGRTLAAVDLNIDGVPAELVVIGIVVLYHCSFAFGA